MSLKNLEAALLQLKGKATEHFGAIEILINNPTAISDHTEYVAEIIRHAKGLSECEEAYGSLQTHFVPRPAPAPAPEPAPSESRPESEAEFATVTAESSPTMKRALKRTTSRKKREAKKDEK